MGDKGYLSEVRMVLHLIYLEIGGHEDNCAQVDEAEALKLKGNEVYSSGDYKAAVVRALMN